MMFLRWADTWTPLCINTDKNNTILSRIVFVNISIGSLQRHDRRQRKLKWGPNLPRYDLAGEAQFVQMDDWGRVSDKDQVVSLLNNDGHSSGLATNSERLKEQNVRKRNPTTELSRYTILTFWEYDIDHGENEVVNQGKLKHSQAQLSSG